MPPADGKGPQACVLSALKLCCCPTGFHEGDPQIVHPGVRSHSCKLQLTDSVRNENVLRSIIMTEMQMKSNVSMLLKDVFDIQ